MTRRKPKPATYGNGQSWPADDPKPRRKRMCWDHKPVWREVINTARYDGLPMLVKRVLRCSECGAYLGKEWAEKVAPVNPEDMSAFPEPLPPLSLRTSSEWGAES